MHILTFIFFHRIIYDLSDLYDKKYFTFILIFCNIHFTNAKFYICKTYLILLIPSVISSSSVIIYELKILHFNETNVSTMANTHTFKNFSLYKYCIYRGRNNKNDFK